MDEGIFKADERPFEQHTFVRLASKNGKTASDVREDQEVDKSRQKFRMDLMTHVEQLDDDAVGFFYEADTRKRLRVQHEKPTSRISCRGSSPSGPPVY